MPKFQVPPPPQLNSLRLGDEIPFSGINLKDADTAIGNGQSPYAINVNLDDGGKPAKRRGQTYLFTASKGSSGMHGYYKELFQGKHVYAWSTGLYSYDEDTETESTLITGLADADGYFYVFNDVLYYKNGTDFISVQSDFTTVDVIDSLGGYIPTIMINKDYDGTGGDANEDINLIQPGFTELFNGDNSHTGFTLSYTDLDDTEVTASVGGVTKTEDTDFTVNRTTGIVTFTTAPATGTNNVSITAYKTFSGNSDMIVKATRAALYGGGTNDSRVFCCGNPDYKNAYFYSGLTGNTSTDALYYPYYGFNRIGSDAKEISNFSYLYAKLLALKEDGIYKISYSSSSGEVTFPAEILNRQVGCDMPDSVQIIKNFPVFGNTQSGLWTIVNVLTSDEEKNVEHISVLIDKPPVQVSDINGILEEETEDLQDATSLDDGKKYYLCINNHCWVWDYERSPYRGDETQLIWFYYTNMSARAWHYSSREIYYADRDIGQLVRFHDNYNDFGEAIDGRWKTKLFNFGVIERKKDVPELVFTTRAVGNSTIQVIYYNDNGEQLENTAVPVSGLKSFDWDDIDWDSFTWDVQRYAYPIRLRPKIKKINYFSAEFRNNVLNENLSVLSLVIKYTFSTYVK
jgi:hypothetical protein